MEGECFVFCARGPRRLFPTDSCRARPPIRAHAPTATQEHTVTALRPPNEGWRCAGRVGRAPLRAAADSPRLRSRPPLLSHLLHEAPQLGQGRPRAVAVILAAAAAAAAPPAAVAAVTAVAAEAALEAAAVSHWMVCVCVCVCGGCEEGGRCLGREEGEGRAMSEGASGPPADRGGGRRPRFGVRWRVLPPNRPPARPRGSGPALARRDWGRREAEGRRWAGRRGRTLLVDVSVGAE